MELSTSEIIAIAQLVSSEIDRTNNQKAKNMLTALLGKKLVACMAWVHYDARMP